MANHTDARERGAAGEDEIDRIQRDWLRERPGAPVAPIGVLTRIRRIAKLADDAQRRALAHLDIDVATRDLLSTLRRAGPPYRLPAGELARRSLVSAGAVSQRVARAERQGLVRRAGSDADGRTVTVELTPAGHALIDRTVDALFHHEERLLAGLPAEQQEQLGDLLRVLLLELTDQAA